MNGYSCPHGIPEDEYCAECAQEESASHTYSVIPPEGLPPEYIHSDDDVEYEYNAGRNWCDEDYTDWLEYSRNATPERNTVTE